MWSKQDHSSTDDDAVSTSVGLEQSLNDGIAVHGVDGMFAK